MLKYETHGKIYIFSNICITFICNISCIDPFMHRVSLEKSCPELSKAKEFAFTLYLKLGCR